jgi:DNA-binding winged helix-turn-helix (wHTH) protein/pimeloyl-ACP methyl ester carboxylesterase
MTQLYTFGPFILDPSRRELRDGATLIEVEPQVFDLLVHLIRNQDRVVSGDELFDTVWNGRIVSLSTLTSRINAARTALGDSGAEQKFIKTVPRKGYRFIGQAVTAGEQRAAKVIEAPPLRQDIRFCRSGDGTKIAWSSVGEGMPVVRAGTWLSHLDYDWQSPLWRHLLHWFSTQSEFVRYDARGNGLSDWEVEDISFEAFVDDLSAVVDAAGLDRFVLFGASQSCAVSIAYAVRHPERVSKLILYGGFAQGRGQPGKPQSGGRYDAIQTLVRQDWGKDNPFVRQIFTTLFVPDASGEQMRWFNETLRTSISPANAARMRDAISSIDVRDLLAQVSIPTLVLHCKDDAAVPFNVGRELAAGIPNARLVALEGANHVILETDPGWPRFQEEVAAFLAL